MYSVYLVNKHGSLLFSQDFVSRPNISVNEKIRLASTFHAISAMAVELTPSLTGLSSQTGGIDTVTFNNCTLYCKHCYTGLQIILVCDTSYSRKSSTISDLLNQIHALYSDYVLKNPFYHLDMPIRLAGFNRGLKQLLLT
jgi:hypothetical protein